MQSKYLYIYEELLKRIQNNTYVPNQKLPSENTLMTEFDVSRDTIRKALSLLEQDGFIHKVKGKGSIVLDINRFNFPVSGIVSFKELATNMEMKSETILEEFKTLKGSKHLSKALNISLDDELWRIVRVRKIDDERVILDKDYLCRKYVSNLTEEICKNSIYEYIENTLGLEISFAKKEITIEYPNDEDKKYLDLQDDDMIVVIKSFVYLNDASLFQYTQSRHRHDKFRFVDFARRK